MIRRTVRMEYTKKEQRVDKKRVRHNLNQCQFAYIKGVMQGTRESGKLTDREFRLYSCCVDLIRLLRQGWKP